MSKPKHYTDKYYAKDGYRTRQYGAKLELSGILSKPQEGYKYNEFINRRGRRTFARKQGIYKHGLWKQTVAGLDNIQTYVIPLEDTDDEENISR